MKPSGQQDSGRDALGTRRTWSSNRLGKSAHHSGTAQGSEMRAFLGLCGVLYGTLPMVGMLGMLTGRSSLNRLTLLLPGLFFGFDIDSGRQRAHSLLVDLGKHMVPSDRPARVSLFDRTAFSLSAGEAVGPQLLLGCSQFTRGSP